MRRETDADYADRRARYERAKAVWDDAMRTGGRVPGWVTDELWRTCFYPADPPADPPLFSLEQP